MKSLFATIARQFTGRRKPVTAGASAAAVRENKVLRSLLAGYDAARDGDANRRHWQNADELDANSANSSEVRREIIKRSREETANNPYLAGLTQTLAHDLIGTGPRLQLSFDASLGLDVVNLGRRVSASFKAWLRAAGIADKFRVMHETRVRDGESFALLTTNDKIRHAVKLSLQLIEADQVTTPDYTLAQTMAVDGIMYDKQGNPSEYHVLKQHPGGFLGYNADFNRVKAERMLHWLRTNRPGQGRGIPEFASALELSAIMRRVTQATVKALEYAASISAILKTDLPPNETAQDAYPWRRVEFEHSAAMTLPMAWDITQLRSEHPVSGYAELKRECLNETGRCVNAPLNVISGNSSGYNYSSGRLDHQLYHNSVWIERERFRNVVLDPLFLAWLDEAALIPGVIPDGLPPFGEWLWDWHWDGFTSIDPVKDTKASEMRMANGLSTQAEECAADGKDWIEVNAQREIELNDAKARGLPPPGVSVVDLPPEPEAAPPAPATRVRERANAA